MRLTLLSAVAAILAVQVTGLVARPRTLGGFSIVEHPDPEKRALLQNIVTWDERSLFIHGERIMIFSGEVHPFRLPVPSLWLDVFQKIKALGFNCVSFYVDWALLEGTPGNYSAEGVFALEPFFEAATSAGIYLLARPGPYINAEVSGGGFPGWLQRVRGTLRTTDADFLAATENYARHVASTIAKAQITNGGPVILYQPENEYSGFCCGYTKPDGQYMQDVMDQARQAGIVVPFLSNDAGVNGYNALGTGVGQVDIYGHDGYPLGFDCANPTVWPRGKLPTDWWQKHLNQSPTTPYSVTEFQAGSFDPWGGPGFEKCGILVNSEFERVFYKNDLSFGVKILNLYMTFGGTNWGNLGHPGGYTSYDYAAPIDENRQVEREKYSQLKLIANFVKTSPSYFDAEQLPNSTTLYATTADLTVTPVKSNSSLSTFWVVRHTDYASQESTSYKLTIPTSAGNLTIPQLGGGVLTLNGRDSKIHVSDYDIGGTTLLYSTAEILTWKVFGSRKVVILYGAEGEHHEVSVLSTAAPSLVEGSDAGVTFGTGSGSSATIAWDTSPSRRVVKAGDLELYILDRNSAYNYWIPELSTNGSSSAAFGSQTSTASSLIVKAGYLVRSASLVDDQLQITADFNATTAIEVIGVPAAAKTLCVNGQNVQYSVDPRSGDWSSITVSWADPGIKLPALNTLEWKYIDSLPEVNDPNYDDSKWVVADHATTNNTVRNLTTPTSLYASDYGFHAGSLIYRGHFNAGGNEASLYLNTQGGSAFGHSVWLSQTYLGSWAGVSTENNTNATYNLPQIESGKDYVVTVLIDHMGLEESGTVGADKMKTPRGILNYALTSGSDASMTPITWKLTGNLGGEHYQDRVRGPLNEGGLYAERQGYHLPYPPSTTWESASPFQGLSGPGVAFYTAQFDLDLPQGWDVPMSFNFGNTTSSSTTGGQPAKFRVQLFVNGFQYGKYINHIGPQTSFPVPEGILNYHGTNWLALTLWAHEPNGAKLESFELVHGTPVLTALRDVAFVGQEGWQQRQDAY
ncbi:putative beta-galactosidase A [Exophiala dermatitidis]